MAEERQLAWRPVEGAAVWGEDETPDALHGAGHAQRVDAGCMEVSVRDPERRKAWNGVGGHGGFMDGIRESASRNGLTPRELFRSFRTLLRQVEVNGTLDVSGTGQTGD